MAVNFKIIAALSIVILSLAGCAEINLFDAPKEVMKHPLGTDPLKIGMSKNEVKSIWGNPDQVTGLQPSDEWNTPKEEWVYIGRYSKIPLDKSYMFKTKYLIFDGEHLVSIGDETQSRASLDQKIKL